MLSHYQSNTLQAGTGSTYLADGTAHREHATRAGAIGFPGVMRIWARRKTLMLIVFVSIVAGDISWIALSPRAYESVVKIFVKRARMETLGGERDTSTTGPVDVSESDIRSEIEILRSRDLLEGVVAQCGMAPVSHNPSPADRLLAAVQVHSLEENLKIVPVSKTNIIAVRYRSRNARQASSILHALTGLYMGKHTALHRLHETSEFFGDQETRYRSDLAKAQQNLSAFQQRYEASLLEERKGLNVKRMAELDAVEQQISAEVQDATDRARVLTTERDVLPNMIQSQSRTARNQALLDRLKAHMLELQNKRTELLTRFEPGYPLIKEVDQQTKDTQDAIAHEENPVVVEQIESLNPLRESITAELSRTNSSIAGLLARRRSVINDLASSRQKQRSMEQLTVEHEDLQRNKNVTEANYLLYEKKTEEARIADALDQRKFLNVSILEEPETPVLPVDKHSVVILLLGSILAITCAFGSASAAESLDPLVRSPFELTLRTGMPVLATLSGARILSSVASEMALPAPKEGEQRLRDSFDFEATDPSPS